MYDYSVLKNITKLSKRMTVLMDSHIFDSSDPIQLWACYEISSWHVTPSGYTKMQQFDFSNSSQRSRYPQCSTRGWPQNVRLEKDTVGWK